jgi:hypothetical protein
MKYIAALLVVFSLACAEASAREVVVQIIKQADLDIKHIRVRGGEVKGLPPGREPESFPLTFVVPEGMCQTRITMSYEGRDTPRSEGRVDLCPGDYLIVGRIRQPGPLQDYFESTGRGGLVHLQ